MTRWSPDTCACVVEYDDQINVTAVINKCTKHANTPDDSTHLATVLTHNRKKNAVLNAVIDHLKNQKLPFEGVAVAYDDKDHLSVSGTDGLPTKDIAAVQNIVASGNA